jgi:hypothetical protein
VDALLPALSAVNNPTLTAFFVGTLSISDVSYEDLLEELEAIQPLPEMDSSIVDIEAIHDVYARLQNMASSLSSQELDIVKYATLNLNLCSR